MENGSPANSTPPAPVQPGQNGSLRFSSMRLFTTENTPLTPFACTSAMLLSLAVVHDALQRRRYRSAQ